MPYNQQQRGNFFFVIKLNLRVASFNNYWLVDNFVEISLQAYSMKNESQGSEYNKLFVLTWYAITQ